MTDIDPKDLCRSCRNAFDCMGQGVFGTEICSEWKPAPSEASGESDKRPSEIVVKERSCQPQNCFVRRSGEEDTKAESAKNLAGSEARP